VGDAGARVLGIAWVVAAVALVAAGVLVWRGSSSAAVVTAAAALFSLIVCAAGLPDAFRGLYIDIALIAGLVAVGYRQMSASRSALR
jgi:tryptophan-rich sensory protein